MLGWIVVIIQLLGVASAIRAVMEARTPQGAVAWAIALISFPWVALPLFWIFGRSRFEGYVIERRLDLYEAGPIAKEAHRALIERGLHAETDHARELPFERLAKLPFTTGNDDFANAKRVTAAELHKRSLPFRFAVRAARLAAPVQ